MADDLSISTEPDAVQQPNVKRRYSRSLSDEYLTMIIDIDNGLLDRLYSDDVLSESQIDRFGPSSKSTQTDRISDLLREISRSSPELEEKFLSALEKTKQSHVANYIRNDGKRPTSDPDNWPIDQNVEHVRLRQAWNQLIELIDSRNGLLDELLAAECINTRQKEWIEVEQENEKRNSRLIRTIRRTSVRNYNKFIRCLEKTKQCQAASIIEANATLEQRHKPLTEQQKTQIITNYSELVDLIVCEDGFIGKLYSKGCITRRQMQFIEAASHSAESNGRLLNIILRGSQEDFSLFVDCLAETGQRHLSSLLLGDGVVTSVVAKTTGSDSLKQHEKQVTREFVSIFSKASPKVRQQLMAILTGLCDQSGDIHLELIAMQPENSVKLFFVCNSLSGLFQLNELFVSGKLREIIQRLFNELLGNQEIIKINSLVWESSDYNAAAQYLLNKHGLPISSLNYKLALRSSHVATEPSTSSQPTVDQLPHELVELVMMKSAGQLLVAVRNSAPRADVITITVLCSVCQYWWEAMSFSHRQKNHLLRLHLKRMCATYKFNPKLITSLRIPQCKNMSVAELHDKAYVVGAESSTIHVTRVPQSNCDTLEEIKIPELREPGDIVACSVNNCLYISDAKSLCIWRANLSSSTSNEEETVKKIISTDYVPWTLSLRSSQLLVTSYGGSVLYVYRSSDGELVRKIELPPYMLARHAVLTGDDSVIVCPIYNWSIDATESDANKQSVSISKVSSQGQVLGACNGDDLKRVRPNYLTTDGSNHLLVSDPDNKRIIHLNSDLKMQQILVAQLAGNPRRMCYSQLTGLLYICYYALPEITVYNVTARN